MVAAMLVGLSGCSHQPQVKPDRSPEYRRAASLLKPLPPELGSEQAQSDLAEQAFNVRYHRTIDAAWEFFGSLSDEQIERLQTTKELRIPVPSLTEKQRAALFHYFDVWRETMKGLPADETSFSEDWLVALYKFGAKQDLSNVEVRFLVRASGIVAMMLRVQLPDGSFSPPLAAGLGQMITQERSERRE
jgi:hypothetical protein